MSNRSPRAVSQAIINEFIAGRRIPAVDQLHPNTKDCLVATRSMIAIDRLRPANMPLIN
ncbi:hypothetical protein NLM27_07910 [Bradyrhizobium sp. CCGB12]|uniref:hypothetical protein n=1 Tax=Bradyrhizobium sp. CCGB12 TaxID=2949632 RepID=UPI0020B2FFAD|nr:hypothetical protein [Bradyrhizobium sp. CCGB12]MCP3388705.1 hypothetical protein [Bradyrhizobium sp. CCGB12]